MRAAYYTKLGAARDVLHIGEVDTPSPGPVKSACVCTSRV